MPRRRKIHSRRRLESGRSTSFAIDPLRRQPNADAGSLPVWFVSKLSKTSTTVALSGEGADELFAGYLTCRADILAGRARYVPRGLLRTALAAAQRLPVSDEKIGFEYKLKRFLEGSLLSPGDAHVFWNGTFSGNQKQLLVKSELPGSFHGLMREILSRSDIPPQDNIEIATDDVLAILRALTDAAGERGEVRRSPLEHRVSRALSGYLGIVDAPPAESSRARPKRSR